MTEVAGVTGVSELLEMLVDARYLPAVGLVLISIVAAVRSLLALRIPWFATRLGGYVLGFGSAALLYFGEALRSGAPITTGLLLAALAAGWTAAGGFEFIRDLISATNTKARPPMIVLLVAGSVLALSCSSCKTLGDSRPGVAVIECAEESQSEIAELALEFLPLLEGESPRWREIKDLAILAGVNVGGCALAETVNWWLSKRRAGTVADSWRAWDTLENWRATVGGGATIRSVRYGDL